jgi:hypothetical protein
MLLCSDERQSKKRGATMRKSGLLVPAAALLSGIFAATVAAQDSDRNALTASSASLATGQAEPRGGNPLWAFPVNALRETNARPLFSPSRRPPAAPVPASLASSPAKPPPPRKPEPDHPLLTLLGTVVGGSVEIGVFTDEASHDVIRLKAGEAHDGWTLNSVSGRAATFNRQGARATTLVLPAPGAETNTPSVANTFVYPLTPPAPKGGGKRPPREG